MTPMLGVGASILDPSLDIADLVQGFARHIKALKSSETKEAVVSQSYCVPSNPNLS